MFISILYIIFLILLLMAGVSDVRRRLIPNRFPAAIVALFLPAVLAGAIEDWPGHLLVGAASFAVCLPLFAYGLLGGGDAQLLPATALWAGPDLIAVFLLATAVAGGGIALVMLLRRRVARGATPAGDAGGPNRTTVPYGVAIAAGGGLVASQSLVNAFHASSTVLSASGV